MKPTIYTLITAVLLLSSTAVCYAQQTSKKAKKNTIELFIPISHFFDGTQTNWLILASRGSGLGSRMTLSSGLRYSRKISSKEKIMLSALFYGISYPDNRDRIAGETISRFYGQFSLGYLRRLNAEIFSPIYALTEVNFRYGEEDFHLHYPFPNEEIGQGILFEDIGLTAGLRMEKSLPFNFTFSTEVKYTRFILGLEEGFDRPELEKPKQTSPNVFTINLGLGYRF